MRFSFFAFFLVVLVVAAALPSPPLGEEEQQELTRVRRATCDLASVQTKWVTFNHSLCAAHCIAKRYKGGRCRDGICHCRK